MQRLTKVFGSLSVTVFFMIGVGCGGSTPPAESAASAKETSTSAVPSKKADGNASMPPDTSTSSSVHIDDAILKACGISAPEAYFAYDSANVKPDEVKPLDKIATCFISGPMKGRSLKLIGRADPRGESEYNMTLGQSRADAVTKYLNARGLDKAKTESTSRGAMEASGSDEPSWAKDRRVDVMLGQ
ncbi:MAG: hypothetical protein NVS3B20_12110 [Polyangiales bacterium]